MLRSRLNVDCTSSILHQGTLQLRNLGTLLHGEAAALSLGSLRPLTEDETQSKDKRN